MKNRLVLFFCLALMVASTTSFAQMTKKEKKEWKKKAKQYAKSPETLKQLTEEKQVADNSVADLSGKVSSLEASLGEKDSRITALEDELAQAKSQLSAARAEIAQLKTTPAAPAPMDFSRGVVFKVQIGAFKNKDLSKYFENNPNFGGEAAKGESEPQKLTIGVFRDYWEADTFKKYMRDMGVKDAWIVPYKDGQRVEIKDVLEGVTSDKPAEGTK